MADIASLSDKDIKKEKRRLAGVGFKLRTARTAARKRGATAEIAELDRQIAEMMEEHSRLSKEGMGRWRASEESRHARDRLRWRAQGASTELPDRGAEGRHHIPPQKSRHRPGAPDITGVTAPKSARKSAAMKALKKMGPKALGIGLLGKLASLPGAAEAAEVVGRDERSIQGFFQDYESMLGASPAREEFPVFELDEERRRAASAQMRSGRTGLRPGWDDPPITEAEEIFVRAAPRPRRRK